MKSDYQITRSVLSKSIAQRFVLVACFGAAIFSTGVSAQLFDKFNNVIPDTEGLSLQPQSQFNDRSLQNLQIPGYVSGREVDISGSTFENSDLRGAFIFADLSDVDFTNSLINNARVDAISESQLMQTASYQNNDLSGLSIAASLANNPKSWDFENKNLQEAILGANFRGANFRDADLRGAELSGTSEPGQNPLAPTFRDADFSGALIQDAVIFAGSLTSEQVYSTASYQSQNLRGVAFRAKPVFFSLVSYDLTGWNFQGQDMTGGEVKNAIAIDADFSNANLSRVDASYADLTRAQFQNARMFATDLFASNLSSANFAGGSLVNADLRSSDMQGANFQRTNLANASLKFADNLQPESFDADSQYNQWTEFPDGFDPAANGLTFFESPTGDYDGDQVVGAADIDLMSERVRRSDNIDYLRIDDYEEGWVIVDIRYSDYVYVSNNVVANGVSDGDPIFTTYGVQGLTTFDATTEEELDEFVASIRKRSDNNSPWLEASFDLDGDGRVRNSDRAFLIESVLQTGVGDSNLDGQFDSTDLILAFRTGRYEDGFNDNSTWATGDWNGDRDFSSRDLVLAFAEGRYDMGPRAAMAVPEPSTHNVLLLLIATMLLTSRKQNSSQRS